jgi:hypothetical protein
MERIALLSASMPLEAALAVLIKMAITGTAATAAQVVDLAADPDKEDQVY